jgi:16S rRNA (cytidine1402-2'-O)-methyltransferase
MLDGTSRSQASRIVAEQISQSRKYVYQLALAIDLDAAMAKTLAKSVDVP